MRAPFAVLIEEAGEAANASEEDLATELADLQEVVDALISARGLTRSAVRSLQEQRRAERGAFSRRLRLLWTQYPKARRVLRKLWRMTLTEPDVVEHVHAFLKQRSVARLYTDSHDSLRGHAALEPYQRFTVDLGEFVVHPDLVALEADDETLLAIEAKGSGYRDAFTGLTQAELYQVAFHRTYLAADAGSIPERLKAFARLKNVALLAVGDSVQVVYEPDARLPLHEAHRAIVRQLEITGEVADRLAFTYNLPTHYLVWAIALAVGRTYTRTEAKGAIAAYPLPTALEATLRGARSLGILRGSRDSIELTEAGAATRVLLPKSLAEWAEIHECEHGWTCGAQSPVSAGRGCTSSTSSAPRDRQSAH